MDKKWSFLLSIVMIGGGTIFFSISAYSFSLGFFAGDKMNEQSQNLAPPAIEDVHFQKGELVGLLSVPKLDLSLPIYEGTEESVLKKGVGHYSKSSLPGENNNIVLSGHRDTVFREFERIGLGDQLIVRMGEDEYMYKVKKVRIVDKDDRTVMVPKPKETLTVTTCYPFQYIGNAPKRYVLIAERIKKRD